MQKLLMATVAIVLFAVVVMFFINQQDVTSDVVLQPQIHTKDQHFIGFDGDQYVCDNGSTLYVTRADDQAMMILAYPDGLFGTATMPAVAGEEGMYADKENKLTLRNDMATFSINDIIIVENCKQEE